MSRARCYDWEGPRVEHSLHIDELLRFTNIWVVRSSQAEEMATKYSKNDSATNIRHAGLKADGPKIIKDT